MVPNVGANLTRYLQHGGESDVAIYYGTIQSNRGGLLAFMHTISRIQLIPARFVAKYTQRSKKLNDP
jgi:hypothetical protein